jgi:transcriptional regulator with XRE-family HTH domain
MERVRKDRPQLTDDYDHSVELRTLIDRLKSERTLQGLSLGEVARMTEVARSALSRLESGEYCNPTLHTLFRYAHALGCRIELSARSLSVQDETGTDAARHPGTAPRNRPPAR